MRPGTDKPGTGVNSKGPTASATRYEGIGGVRPNAIVLVAAAVVSSAAGALATAASAAGIASVTCHGILKAGSSQHGKAFRAWRSSNCVKRYGSPRLTVL